METYLGSLQGKVFELWDLRCRLNALPDQPSDTQTHIKSYFLFSLQVRLRSGLPSSCCYVLRFGIDD